MMGDNRDNSSDSRLAGDQGGVGYVPFENLIGRGEIIFFSIGERHARLGNLALAVGRALEPHLPARALTHGSRRAARGSIGDRSSAHPSEAASRRGRATSVDRFVHEQARESRTCRSRGEARPPLPRSGARRLALTHLSAQARAAAPISGSSSSATGCSASSSPTISIAPFRRRAKASCRCGSPSSCAAKPAPRSPPNGTSARMWCWGSAKRGAGAARRRRSSPTSANR